MKENYLPTCFKQKCWKYAAPASLFAVFFIIYESKWRVFWLLFGQKQQFKDVTEDFLHLLTCYGINDNILQNG